jgi:hypothetical protein
MSSEPPILLCRMISEQGMGAFMEDLVRHVVALIRGGIKREAESQHTVLGRIGLRKHAHWLNIYQLNY